MNRIHDNKVNNISEYNLLNAILNLSKLTKKIDIHYYPILHGCMDTRRGKLIFRNFRILLNSRYWYIIVMIILIANLKTKEDAVMKCHKKAGDITTNLKV